MMKKNLQNRRQATYKNNYTQPLIFQKKNAHVIEQELPIKCKQVKLSSITAQVPGFEFIWNHSESLSL